MNRDHEDAQAAMAAVASAAIYGTKRRARDQLPANQAQTDLGARSRGGANKKETRTRWNTILNEADKLLEVCGDSSLMLHYVACTSRSLFGPSFPSTCACDCTHVPPPSAHSPETQTDKTSNVPFPVHGLT